jgi:hypothetical protein
MHLGALEGRYNRYEVHLSAAQLVSLLADSPVKRTNLKMRLTCLGVGQGKNPPRSGQITKYTDDYILIGYSECEVASKLDSKQFKPI